MCSNDKLETDLELRKSHRLRRWKQAHDRAQSTPENRLVSLDLSKWHATKYIAHKAQNLAMMKIILCNMLYAHQLRPHTHLHTIKEDSDMCSRGLLQSLTFMYYLLFLQPLEHHVNKLLRFASSSVITSLKIIFAYNKEEWNYSKLVHIHINM